MHSRDKSTPRSRLLTHVKKHALHRPRPVRGAYCDSVVKQNGAGSNPLLAAPASVRIAAVPSARKPCDSPFGAVCVGWASGAPRVLGSSNEYSNGLRAMVRS